MDFARRTGGRAHITGSGGGREAAPAPAGTTTTPEST